VSTLAIIIIVFVALDVLLLVGGLIARNRRDRAGEADFSRNLTEVDRAFEQARAADRGWDRAVLEATAQKAIEDQRPGFVVEKLELVLVDDRPGVTEDRAQFLATGPDGELRLVLARSDAGWAAESVG
jgi:hypothetical protein